MINPKKGMTLNEIMLAMLILAATFIPVIGVISSSMKVTEKDDHIIKAISLCQEKLGKALLFPFEEITVGTYKEPIVTKNTEYPVKLILGDEIFRIPYKSELTVASETVTFRVPICDFTKKHKNPDNPSSYMSYETIEIKNRVKRYTVTVYWDEKEGESTKERFYTLSTLKANVRR